MLWIIASLQQQDGVCGIDSKCSYFIVMKENVSNVAHFCIFWIKMFINSTKGEDMSDSTF